MRYFRAENSSIKPDVMTQYIAMVVDKVGAEGFPPRSVLRRLFLTHQKLKKAEEKDYNISNHMWFMAYLTF